MRRKKKRDAPTGAPAWMATFSDLMTLILTFFVLLFAFSEIDARKFKAFQESFMSRQMFEGNPSLMDFDFQGKEVKGQDTKEKAPEDDSTNPLEKIKVVDVSKAQNEKQLDEMVEKVQKFLEQQNLQAEVSAQRTPRGVELVLQDGLLFRSGEAEIVTDALPFLNKLTELFQTLPNEIIVEGHTDNQPISNFMFPSNWELSSARSSRVVRYFTDRHKVDPSRFVAIGHGDTKPIASNSTPEGRAKNRRVVIAISTLSIE